MSKFIEYGKIIDDIRKEIKEFNVQFEESPWGDEMIITIPPSTIKLIIKPKELGYEMPKGELYKELLEMSIEQLKMFNQ